MKSLIIYKWIILGIIVGFIVAGVTLVYLFRTPNKTTDISKDTEPITEESSVTIPAQDEFKLFIPRIGIEAPIITGIDPKDEIKYNEALKNGILLMPGAGEVGKPGNVFIYGHSSSDDVGNYTRVFRSLNDLAKNDVMKIVKNGAEYNYTVYEKKVIEATDFSVLEQTKDETLTLMTCWPIGTDKQRLVVISKRQ